MNPVKVPRLLLGNDCRVSGNRLHFMALAFMISSNLRMSVDRQILSTIFCVFTISFYNDFVLNLDLFQGERW